MCENMRVSVGFYDCIVVRQREADSETFYRAIFYNIFATMASWQTLTQAQIRLSISIQLKLKF